MRTIVHVFGTMNRGGAEMRTLELLRKRRRSDEHHLFVALSGLSGTLDEDFRTLNCEVIPRRLSPGFPLWFIRLLRQRGATHVHSHVHVASGYLLLLAWVARVPRRIAHFHSMGDGRPSRARRLIYRRIGRALVRLVATDVVAVSGAVLRVVIGSSAASSPRFSVLHDQVDGGRFTIRSADGFEPLRLGIIGRLDADKNPERCLEVVAALRRRAPGKPLTAWFAGNASASELAHLHDRVDDLGLVEIVEFLGVRDDVPALLERTHVLLSTTRREGLPGAIIEAAAAGVPAVVSAIAPNEEASRFLPGVVTVPLEATDDEWCAVIEDVLARGSDRFAGPTVRAAFDRSPFALTDDNTQVDALWS